MANIELSRGERLDQRVVSLLPTLSRSFATRLIDEGKVTVNGVVATKGGLKLRLADEVVVDYDPASFTIPDIELPILYEDNDCVVIVKPVGLLTHSKGAFNPEPSVATWLHGRIKDEVLLDQDKNSLNNRAGIVHRLDRATSGVMICAKTPKALAHLQKQFAQRKTKKTYAAVVAGELKEPEAVIDMPIGRNPKAPATFRVDVQGKASVTHYRTVASNGKHSLLELKPTTGRTHQLRVHLNHLGHPIVGDHMYGGEPADRLFLHAEELEITIPKNSERKVFRAPIPLEFQELIG
ncbi:RluA family pseudouridine synthase [Candidatus Saccharibacteria bacterium]|nr:MAG: RluA family pseudouridine synthase [Candidatus Saccharibacteria bacterium]